MYAGGPMDTNPLMDEMLTMLPPPARRMAGITALVPRNTPLAFDCHDVVPVVGSGFLNVLAQHYGGVVHQHVHFAEPLLGGSHGVLPIIGVGDV